MTCYCDGSCPNNVNNGTCETRPGGSCFSAVEEVYDETTGTYEEERTFGCMPPEENGGFLMVIIILFNSNISEILISLLIPIPVQSFHSTPPAWQKYRLL